MAAAGEPAPTPEPPAAEPPPPLLPGGPLPLRLPVPPPHPGGPAPAQPGGGAGAGTKKPPPRTAAAVIQRIRGDPRLDPADVAVGCADRSRGGRSSPSAPSAGTSRWRRSGLARWPPRSTAAATSAPAAASCGIATRAPTTSSAPASPTASGTGKGRRMAWTRSTASTRPEPERLLTAGMSTGSETQMRPGKHRTARLRPALAPWQEGSDSRLAPRRRPRSWAGPAARLPHRRSPAGRGGWPPKPGPWRPLDDFSETKEGCQVEWGTEAWPEAATAPRQPRPTHFVALMVTEPGLRARVAKAQEELVRAAPSCAAFLAPPQALHLTLALLRLGGPGETAAAISALKRALSDPGLPVSPQVAFRQRVLLGPHVLCAIPSPSLGNTAHVLSRRPEAEGLRVLQPLGGLHPHLTLAKVPRALRATSPCLGPAQGRSWGASP